MKEVEKENGTEDGAETPRRSSTAELLDEMDAAIAVFERPVRRREAADEPGETSRADVDMTEEEPEELPLSDVETEHEEAHRHDSEAEVGELPESYEESFYEPDDTWACSWGGLAIAFLVPVFLMIVIFIQRGIFPFGEETFLRTDMYHQYAPFFSEFKYKLATGGSLLYSWDVGMGVNFSALYAYYLASPFNWLLLLCPAKYVIEFMTYSIVGKIGLSGLSMAYYLRKHCGTRDFGVGYFGIFYALSGYMAAYSWNIMWLDCIILFPLVMLGLERLVKDGKTLLYCLALGCSILSNYYISIMTCIFMVIYFIALLVLDGEMSWEKFVGRSFRFAFSSLLAGGLAAAVLLPEIYALQVTASGEFSFPKTYTQYFPIFDMIARHIGNVEVEIGLEHWPNLYCGVAVLMLFVLYLLNRRISAREKAVSCTILLLFMASFSINVLNFIWHGFHYPNSLPCRQSYIYILLLLTMCYRAYMYLDETPWQKITLSFAAAVIFVLMAQKLVTGKDFHFLVFYVAILFLGLYLGAIAMYRRGGGFRQAAFLYTLMVVAVEAGINTTVTSVTTTSRTAYTEDNADVEALVASLTPNDTFFRMEKVSRKTKNDGAWMHFPSVSLFSSTADANLSDLFRKLGCESSTNAYSITGSTPLVDSLFSVKYGIYSEEPTASGLRRFLAREGDTWLYENVCTLPVGFAVASDFESRWNLEFDNPADVQNSLADAADASVVLEMQMDVDPNANSVTFYPQENGEYYAFIGNKKIEKVSVSTMSLNKTVSNVDRGFLVELGFCYAGEEVTLKGQDTSEALNASVYRFSEEGLREVYAALSRHPWQITSWTDTHLEGTVSCEEAGYLMTTIPYDRGWTITVDGAKQPSCRMIGAFTSVWMNPGSHTVSMDYEPEGLSAGWLITIGSALILTAVTLGEWMYRRYAGRSGYDNEDEE
ncbi:MAG: YfhO family protein [Clostridiales bacterium]|nr:YfhO family protein [Clostridiales bacterium]